MQHRCSASTQSAQLLMTLLRDRGDPTVNSLLAVRHTVGAAPRELTGRADAAATMAPVVAAADRRSARRLRSCCAGLLRRSTPTPLANRREISGPGVICDPF